MELADIVSQEQWLALERDFFEKSGLACNIFDPEGVRITNFKKWVNRLCPVIKADDRGQSFICAVAHMNIAGFARKTKKAFIGECDAGLVKLVVPIFIKDEFRGAAGACGFLLDDGAIDSFMIQRTIDMNEETIASLSHDIKKISHREMDAFAQYVKERLDHILHTLP